MIKSRILDKTDIIIDDNDEMITILNENFNELSYHLERYFTSLLLDVRLNEKSGYCFYNDVISLVEIIGEHDIDLLNSINQVKKDIKYLQYLAMREIPQREILNLFYEETLNEYRVLNEELTIYIAFGLNILLDKLD